MPTIQQLADTAFRAFERKERDNGESFYKFADGSPDWLSDMAHAAHGDMLPDDFRYSFIRDALSSISEADTDSDADDLRDMVGEWADSDTDVYNSRLALWLASHASRVEYVDDAVDEFGRDESRGVVGMLQLGQMKEREEVYFALIEYLDNMASDDESEEETADSE